MGQTAHPPLCAVVLANELVARQPPAGQQRPPVLLQEGRGRVSSPGRGALRRGGRRSQPWRRRRRLRALARRRRRPLQAPRLRLRLVKLPARAWGGLEA
eukprot:scaffold73516_cov36-Phaeocystis_antarctica.AAC.1